MASSRDFFTSIGSLKEKVLEEYLTCVICSETFTNPHQLKCQHTFCLNCLQTYIANSNFMNSFPCPVCRTNIPIVLGSPDACKHLFMENMVSFFKNLKDVHPETQGEEVFPTSVSQFCKICDEERNSTTYCPTCVAWLCDPCTKGHKKIPATKSHTLMPVAEFYQFIEGLIKERCLKMAQLKENIEVKMLSLQSANYTSNEITQRIETQIDARFKKLLEALDIQKNKLLTILETKSSDISREITRIATDLEKILERVCGVTELYENMQKAPGNLQESQLDDMDKACEFLLSDFNTLEGQLLNSTNVPIIEYKPVYGNYNLEDSGTSFGEIFVRPNRQVTNTYVGDGVITWMNSSSCDKITDLIVFDDKHYIVVTAERLLYFDNNDVTTLFYTGTAGRRQGSQSFPSNVCAWGIAKVTRDKFIVTCMGNCLGSGQICIMERKPQGYVVTDIMAQGMTSPRGMSMGLNGCFLVCDQHDRCVYVFHSDGKLKQIVKKSKDGSSLFTQPMYVTQSQNGDIIVSDHGSHVKILNADGDLKATYVSCKPESEFWGVTTDCHGNILVADWTYGIHILSCHGEFKTLRSDFPAGTHPMSIDRHPSHNTFMIGTASGQIFFMN